MTTATRTPRRAPTRTARTGKGPVLVLSAAEIATLLDWCAGRRLRPWEPREGFPETRVLRLKLEKEYVRLYWADGKHTTRPQRGHVK